MALFTYSTGTSGYTTTPFNVMTTELNSMLNNGVAVSSVGGSSGAFTQTDTGNAIFGHIWFKSGGTFTPSSVSAISGWFITSPDGAAFEKNAAAPTRNPDFVIPFLASAYGTGDFVFSQGGLVRLWAPTVKILITQNTGATFPATGNLLVVGPVKTQVT